jgi:diguanylate cyclase (GGDEF)-like protein
VELQDAVQKLEQMALTDELTGLANRRRLQGLLGQMFAQAVRYRQDLACIMADLDGFKAINDTLGHQKGDEALAIAGRLIAEQVRLSDVAARFGGDEFIVILPHTGCATASHLAQRLVDAFEARVGALCGPGAQCSMSIGIACLNVSRPDTPDQLLAHADKALYAAKKAGRRRIMVCGADGVPLPPEQAGAPIVAKR